MEEELRKAQAEGKQAATAGLELLKEIKRLETDNDLLRKQNIQEFEELQTANTALERRLEVKERLLKDVDGEMCSMIANYDQEKADEIAKLTDEYERRINAANQKTCSFEAQLKDALDSLDDVNAQLVAAKREIDAKLKMEFHLSDDSLESTSMADIKAELARITADRDCVFDQRKDCLNRIGHLKTELDQIRQELQVKNEEIEEAVRARDEYKTELAHAKEEMSELRVELTSVKLEGGPGKKGNSMFSELDDHRRRLESELVAMKRRYDASVAENDELRKRNDTLNNRIACTLLLRADRSQDSERDALEAKNTQLQRELKSLRAKFEKQQSSTTDSATHKRTDSKKASASGGKDDLFRRLNNPSSSGNDRLAEHGMLNTVVERLRQENTALRSECDTILMERNAAEDVIIENKRKVDGLQQQVGRLQTENAQLQMRLDNSKKTVNSEAMSGRVAKKTERIPLGPSSDANRNGQESSSKLEVASAFEKSTEKKTAKDVSAERAMDTNEQNTTSTETDAANSSVLEHSTKESKRRRGRPVGQKKTGGSKTISLDTSID